MKTDRRSLVLDTKWLTLSGGIDALHAVYSIHMGHGMRSEYKQIVPQKVLVQEEWLEFIEASCGRYAEDCVVPFAFTPPYLGGARIPSFSLRPNYSSTLVYEKKKGREIFALATLARRVMDQPVGNRLLIHGGSKDRRKFGRLTSWCKAQLGLNAFQREHDSRHRAGARPRGRGRGRGGRRGRGRGGRGRGRGRQAVLEEEHEDESESSEDGDENAEGGDAADDAEQEEEMEHVTSDEEGNLFELAWGNQ
jgi:hypothetical protein